MSLEHAQIVQLYIINNYSIVKTQRKFRAKFKSRLAPAKNSIKKIYKKFTSKVYLLNFEVKMVRFILFREEKPRYLIITSRK